tara:strand:- start:115 stop:1977 length:1863 start_codon:yes stop_codon:yes gene_type:complete
MSEEEEEEEKTGKAANSYKNTSVINKNHMNRYKQIVPEGKRFANGTVKVSKASKLFDGNEARDKADNNDQFGAFNDPVDLRPAPLISITTTPIRNKLGYIGAVYDITLNGTIIGSVDDSENKGGTAFESIMRGQRFLETLFNADLLKLSIDNFGDEDLVTFYPTLESINFEEGTYHQICRYTISLKASAMYTGQDGATLHDTSKMGLVGFDIPEEYRKAFNGIEDFNQTFQFDQVEGQGYQHMANSSDDTLEGFRPRVFTVTRTLTATSAGGFNKAIEGQGSHETPVEHAQRFIKQYHDSTSSLAHRMNNSFLGVAYSDDTDTHTAFQSQAHKYSWYNNVRTESSDYATGSYTLTDQWTLAPSNHRYLESFNVNITQGNDSNRTKVVIDGTITGLETWAAGVSPRSETDATAASEKAAGQAFSDKSGHAASHFRKLTKDGKFDSTSNIYKRANGFLDVNLNGSPVSVTIGTNRSTGEITYSVEYDNRPSSYFGNVVFENISVNDTYPGDVYAVIPVLGRPTGPILQYSFGRTEYKRSLSIEFMLDSSHLGYETSSRNGLLYTKPSLTEPYKAQIDTLIGMMSPASEPGIRTYLLDPPQESWNPKEGLYSINCSWTYELSE